MTRRRRRPSDTGFTLIELMVIVALISILAGLAAPNLMRMLRRGDLRSEGRQLYAAYLEAQGRAMDSGAGARLKLIRTGANRGWEVWVDADGNGTVERASRHLFANTRPSVGFGPARGFPRAFAAPFGSVPRNAWCTPCGGGNDEGEIIFDQDGTIVGGGSGSIVLENTAGELPGSIEALVFIGATGVVRLEREE